MAKKSPSKSTKPKKTTTASVSIEKETSGEPKDVVDETTQQLVSEIREVAQSLKALSQNDSSTQIMPTPAPTATEPNLQSITSETKPVQASKTETPVSEGAEKTDAVETKTEAAPTPEPVATTDTQPKEDPTPSEKQEEASKVPEEKAETSPEPKAEPAPKPESEASSQPPEKTEASTEAPTPAPAPESPATTQTSTPTPVEETKSSQEDTQSKPKGRIATLVSKLMFWKRKSPAQPAVASTANDPTQKPRKKWMMWVGIGAGVLLFPLLVLAVLTLIAYTQVQPLIANGTKTVTLAQETYTFIKNQDLVEAEARLKATKESLLETQAQFDRLAWVRLIPYASGYHADADAAFSAAVAGVEAAEILFAAVTPYADVLGFKGQGSFSGGTAEDRIVKMVETLDKVTPQLDEIGKKLEVVEASLASIDPADYPVQIRGKEVRARIEQVKTIVEDVTLALTDARPIVEVLPSLLGHPEGKKYLILFQNDGELRPTGGFISAFAVLHLDKGRVRAEKSDDIYSLDNKFGRKVAPPEIIVKYLDEKSWHLRNMNLSPDFKASMQTFMEHYNSLEGEYKVDGVIAIDTTVLAKLVEVIGALEVPGYGTFTVENDDRCNLPQIVCEMEHIIDRPLATLVSNRKSAIMGPMMQVLLQQSLGGGKEQLANLVPLGFDLIEQKHILMYFEDEAAQKAAEVFNAAGRIVETKGDYLHVNNANFGGAKSNFYIDDQVEQEIEIKEDGTVQKKVTLSYTHTQPMDNCNLEAGELCLSGIQRNYFRVYVPQGSTLVEGLGSEVEIKTGVDLGKTVFDGFFTLRPESKGKVVLIYTLPFKVSKGDSYSLLIQKQPGTKDANYLISIEGKVEEFKLHKDTEKSWQL